MERCLFWLIIIRTWLTVNREGWGDEDPIDYLIKLGEDMLLELAFAWEGECEIAPSAEREE